MNNEMRVYLLRVLEDLADYADRASRLETMTNQEDALLDIRDVLRSVKNKISEVKP